jgi:creatinine amidohydrolase
VTLDRAKKGDDMDVRLHTRTWPAVRELLDDDPVIIVPIGALEQHGPHLPLETDFRMADTVAELAAQRASEAGTPTLVTPPIWSGFSPHHMDFQGTVTLRSTTLQAVIRDVAVSLWHHGFRKILFLNGHGGNANLLGGVVQALRFEEGVRVAAASYWSFVVDRIGDWRHSGPGGIDHACEMEMSLMLHVRPEHAQAEAATDGTWFPKSRFLTGDLAIGAPVSVAWSFTELSDDGTLGDPLKASADRGAELLEMIVDDVAGFLAEFRSWTWDDPRAI